MHALTHAFLHEHLFPQAHVEREVDGGGGQQLLSLQRATSQQRTSQRTAAAPISMGKLSLQQERLQDVNGTVSQGVSTV